MSAPGLAPSLPPESRARLLALILVFSLIPLTFSLLALRYKHAVGSSFYASNQDPDSVYFANGLALAEGAAPMHNDHPGTTLQTLTAVTLRVTHALWGQGAFQEDVILHPQVYIDRVLWIPLCAFALAAFAMGWAGYRLTNHVAGGLVAQSGVLMSYWIPLYLLRLRPECLLGAESLFISVLVLMYLKEAESKLSQRLPLFAGLIIGAGIATKITFIPVALVPFVLLPTWRLRVKLVLFSALGLAVCLLPIVSRLPAAFTWWWNLTTHTGMWGTGQTGVVTPSYALQNLENIYPSTKLFFYATGINAIVCLAFWARRANWNRPDLAIWRALLGVLAACLLGMVMVAKHPGQHYLIPELALLGLQGVLLYHVWKTPAYRMEWLKHAMLVLILFFAVRLESVYMIRAMKTYELFLDSQDAARLALPFGPKGRIVLHLNSSSLPGFWHFGAQFFPGRYGEALRKAFPYEYQLEVDGRVGHFNQILSREEIDALVREHPLLIWSHLAAEDLKFPYVLHPIVETPNENLYAVTPVLLPVQK